MREIQLTQGKVALVDDWWFEELNQHKWCSNWSEAMNSFYAVRQLPTLFGKRRLIQMHSVIARTPKGMYTDHINHDTLYNLESNLRVCTPSQNQYNRGKRIDNTSGYKGVFQNGSGWIAKISVNGKRQNLHTFSTPEEAAHAYDEAAKKYHGEFAALNFPD